MKFSIPIWSTLLIASFLFFQEIQCILNGDLVKNLDQHKHLVAIKSQTGSEIELCGGAILNDFMILSAAHCFYDRTTTKFVDKVIVRANTLRNHHSFLGGIERTVKKIFMLKSYVAGKDDDIAIIKVHRSLNLVKNSRKLQNVELPNRDTLTITEGREAIIAGYGVHKFKNEEPYTDRKLRALGVKIVANRNCGKLRAMYSAAKYLCAKPTQIVSGTPRGFCDGDSGGPLVIKNGDKFQILGVIEENAPNCDDSKSPGLYMKVSNYLDSFIDRVIKDKIDSTIIAQELTAKMAFCNYDPFRGTKTVKGR